ncbi:hypothetical protein GH5_06445 [Leishmania sp. Ghana 2012 LV757]|uniref:hypothetical protein n=1 Tax=Leishmania sp. Ghana 2012 LV757 TaxID=2803181 RepID=UPI001B45CAE1|nr:hypothetical protein GH5_06445 [Leishmania sp. Ghana 2012 LV757]
MKQGWGVVRQQTMELLFGPTAEQRHHQSWHRDKKQASEAFMTTSASAAGARHRDLGYAAVRKHFQRIPHMFLDMELYFAITGLGLFDHLAGLLLLPLKVVTLWRRCELRDIIALLVLTMTLGSYWVAGLVTTQLYSYLYHAVRRTSFIKIVMIFSILDVADKILSSLAQDSLEVLYAAVDDEYAYYCACRRDAGSAAAGAPTERAAYGRRSTGFDDVRADAARQHAPPSRWLLAGSVVAACISTSCHSLSLLLHVVTLNVTVNAKGNSLLALLVGNNLTELKGFVFKKNTPESLHSVCALDALERMQYVVFFLVMLLHHMHERFSDFAFADVFVILCVEVAIDFVKHLFLFRFNGILPSVFRAYLQLALLDLSSETVLWRLPSLEVVVGGPDGGTATRMEEAVELLSPAYGFAPKNIKRIGFDAIAYAGLLLWSFGRVAGYLLLQAPLVCFLAVLIIALLKIMLSSIIYGVCARFTLRTLVLAPPSLPLSSSSADTTSLNGGSGSGPIQQRRASMTNLPCASWGVQPGVSPIDAPRETPIGDCHHSQMSAGAALSANGKNGPAAVGTLVRLTPLLIALLKVDRFDLQAGKAKRSY